MSKTYAERLAEGTRMRAEHKARLAREEGLTDHPKLDLLYGLAWEHGHASGWTDIESYFREFAELLK